MTPDARQLAEQGLADAERNLANAERQAKHWRAVVAALGEPGAPEGQSAIADDEFDDANLIEPGEAAQIARRDKSTVRLWCVENGIGIKRAGRWRVSRPRLMRHLGRGRE